MSCHHFYHTCMHNPGYRILEVMPSASASDRWAPEQVSQKALLKVGLLRGQEGNLHDGSYQHTQCLFTALLDLL